MKKSIAILMLTLCLALLCACGETAEPAPETPAPDAQEAAAQTLPEEAPDAQPEAPAQEPEEAAAHADRTACGFFEQLPEIQRLLLTDVQAGFDGDPAAKSKEEIIFSYPGLFAIYVYRLAHVLYKEEIPFIPRVMSEYAHGRTGIDINPGATIGEYFFIDHGTGVVVGETTEIGNNVKLYQGVTLGGTGKEQGKRHPTLEDNVMVSAGAKVIGSFTIGKNSKIGAGSVVIEEVPPNCTVVGVPGRIVRMGDQKVPSADLDQIHLPDPVLNDIRQLQTDNIRLKKELNALKEKLAKEKIIEEA